MRAEGNLLHDVLAVMEPQDVTVQPFKITLVHTVGYAHLIGQIIHNKGYLYCGRMAFSCV